MLGVDACKGGWVAVRLDGSPDGPPTAHFAPDIGALAAAVPLHTLAYRWDIVLRGSRSTLFENRLQGN